MAIIPRYLSRTLALTVCAVFLVHCTKSPFKGNESEIPVEFSGIDIETKADPEQSGFVAGSAIAVSAYHVPNGSAIMFNQKVSYDGTLWTYSPTAYWPSGEGTSADFFAYYPHNESNAVTGVKLANNLLSGEPAFTFTMEESAKADLMVAVRRGHTHEDGPVPLVFRHLVGKVQFRFSVSDEGGFSYIVNKMDLPGAKKEATYAWATDKFEIIQGKTIDIRVGDDTKEYLVNTTDPVLIEDFTMYLLPGKMESVTIGINSEAPQTIDLSELTIESGKSITMTFSIGLTGIKFSTSVTDWTDGGSANGNIS